MRRPIRDLLERLRKEPSPTVVPLRPTWGDWARQRMRGGMKFGVVSVLRFLLWLIGG